jgi:hypothetical protein
MATSICLVPSERNITNRWTGATGSDFRIKRDPAKLLGNAVARSTQPFGCFFLSMNRKRRNISLATLLLMLCGVVAVVAFQRRFDPIDTYPRLYSSVQCSGSSRTAALYLRKTEWFCAGECIEALVRVRDAQNKLVYSERLTTIDAWTDITEIAPRIECTDGNVRISGNQPDFDRELHLAEARPK